MGRPAKSLRAHVQAGTFRARRDTHRALLLGAPLQWPVLASLQRRYKVMAKRCGGSPLHFTKRSKLVLEAGTSGAGSNTLRSFKLGGYVRISWRMTAILILRIKSRSMLANSPRLESSVSNPSTVEMTAAPCIAHA